MLHTLELLSIGAGIAGFNICIYPTKSAWLA